MKCCLHKHMYPYERITRHQNAGPFGCERRRSLDCSLSDLLSQLSEFGSRDVIEHEGSKTCWIFISRINCIIKRSLILCAKLSYKYNDEDINRQCGCLLTSSMVWRADSHGSLLESTFTKSPLQLFLAA